MDCTHCIQGFDKFLASPSILCKGKDGLYTLYPRFWRILGQSIYPIYIYRARLYTLYPRFWRILCQSIYPIYIKIYCTHCIQGFEGFLASPSILYISQDKLYMLYPRFWWILGLTQTMNWCPRSYNYHVLVKIGTKVYQSKSLYGNYVFFAS